MIDFLLSGPNLPFTGAIAVMLAIAVVESISAALGASLSQTVDSLLPDLDLELNAAADTATASAGAVAETGSPGTAGPLGALLGWLCLGQVPVLILLVVFLAAFGLAGLGLQALVQGLTGTLLPGWFAAIPGLAVALPAVRVIGRGLARILPREETYAVSQGSFLGHTAIVTLGTAAAGQPAQAKLRDRHGRTQYVQVVPRNGTDRFPAGTRVVLVERHGAVFAADARDRVPPLPEPS